jgi:uncharacterized membrane protein YkoI
MTYYRRILLLAPAMVLSACNRSPATHESAATSQPPSTQSDSAKIDLVTARRSALVKVPNGKVVSEELEQEGGRLVYSFDLRQGSTPGIEEVQVDARDGSVVSVEHESPSREAGEARQDRKNR